MDPAKLKTRASYKYSGTFYGLCAAPDGRLFAGGSDYSVYAFNPVAEKLEPAAQWTKHDNYVSCLVALPASAGNLIVSGSYDRQLIWWNTSSGEPVRTVAAHDGWVRDLAVLADGSRLVSVGDDMLVKVWDANSGELVRTMDGHARRTPQGHVTSLYVVAVSPDGKHIASGDRVGDVRVWETETGTLAQRFDVPLLYTYDPRQRKRSIGGVRSLAFSPDGKFLAVGGIGQIENVDGLGGPAHLEIWDWQKPQRMHTAGADGFKAIIHHLQFAPGATWLIGAGGGEDGLVAFWKIDVPTSTASSGVGAEPDKTTEAKPLALAHRIKTDLHIHRFALNHAATELYAAGHGRLDVWSPSEV
jgi:WD40 repeat protein